MDSKSARLVDPDFLEAMQVAFVVLIECLIELTDKSTVETIFEDVLSHSPSAESLTQDQKLVLWKMCQMILNKMDQHEGAQ